MKKIFKNSLFFLLPFLLLLVLIVVISKSVLRNGNYFSINKKNTILVLGHSQNECALNDSLISNVVNFSQGGESYFYTYLKLKKMLQANPQINTVILSFTNNQIDKAMDKWIWGDASMQNYYPKYSFMMNRDDYLVLANNNLSSLIKSESYATNYFFNFMIKKNKNYYKDRYCGGYLYLERNKIDSLLKTNYLKENAKINYTLLSKTNIDYCKKIVNLCNENNIKIFFIRVPAHKLMPFYKNEILYKKIKKQEFPTVTLLDFKDYPTKNSELGDFGHLNHIGATKFSLFLNKLMLENFLQNKNPQMIINKEILNLKEEQQIN